MADATDPPASDVGEGLREVSPDGIETDFPEGFIDGIASRNIALSPMVGLGGSAGSISALQEFFAAMPSDSGMVFVVILHLAPDHVSNRLDYPEIVADAERALSQLSVAQREVSARGRNFIARTVPYRSTDDRIAGVVFTFLDITSRKQNEEELRRSEERFRGMVDAIPQLAWVARPDGFIQWYNRNWYKYTGTTPDAVIGWGWQSVHDPKCIPEVLNRWNHSIRTGERFEMLFPIRGADGSFRTFLILALPVATRADGALFVLNRSESLIDITVKSTLYSFVAHLENFDVAITLDPENRRVESTAFHANLSEVKTGIADRDHNMSVWLQTNEFPQAVFELRAVDRSPNGALTARGRFQLHGQAHDIQFPVTVAFNRGLATIDGTATLNTQDFGLPIIRYWVLSVDPVVQIHFHLQGSLTR
jgi:PAS domain S-box-containing protein